IGAQSLPLVSHDFRQSFAEPCSGAVGFARILAAESASQAHPHKAQASGPVQTRTYCRGGPDKSMGVRPKHGILLIKEGTYARLTSVLPCREKGKLFAPVPGVGS